MRLLLDSHSFLWFAGNDSQLRAYVRTLIEDEANDVFLSVGSLWEIAVKVSIGKLTLSAPFGVLIQQYLIQNKITILNITVSHAAVLSNLPLYHREPFDRLFVAQSLVEQIPIVSIDAALDPYGITRIW